MAWVSPTNGPVGSAGYGSHSSLFTFGADGKGRAVFDRNELRVLPREECIHLLTTNDLSVGRVGLVDQGRPIVLPVNYRVRGDAVVFRTDPGTKLDAATKGAWVAFEVDKVDTQWREGWSVLVQGRAERVDSPEELERLRQLLPLHPWAPGDKAHYVRIPMTHVSGRQII